jgi:hypothetical protein
LLLLREPGLTFIFFSIFFQVLQPIYSRLCRRRRRYTLGCIVCCAHLVSGGQEGQERIGGAVQAEFSWTQGMKALGFNP